MRFPGIAYSFQRPTDVSGPTALILSRHEQVSTSAVIVETFFGPLAKDRILVLTNVSAVCSPGAGQRVVIVKVQAFSQGILNYNVDQRFPLQVINQSEVLNWQGEVYIQGGGEGTNTVRIFGQFDAGAVANTLTVGIHGIVIPRGNMGGF